MNTLKKIFLFTLISVFFLSAFSQVSNKTEILGIVNIDRSANPIGGIGHEIGGIIDEPDNGLFGFPSWWLLYRVVRTELGPGWMNVTCLGNGFRMCIPLLSEVLSILKNIRGIEQEVVTSSFQKILEESEELASTGTYQGSLTKKIAIEGDKINFLLFQMNWNYDPKNPYNGQAEIIISKTDNFGF